MNKKIILIIVSIFFLFSCSTVETKYKDVKKEYIPLHLTDSDILISFVISDITFAGWQKNLFLNAANIARRYNLTFDLAVFAEYLNKKHKDTWKIYEENQDIFEIIAGGLNNINPVEPKRAGEFFDITIKKEIPVDLQEIKIAKMKEIFEKFNLKSAMQIFLVPLFSGDENTIITAEKYGYKLIIQQNTGKADDYIRNYTTISASKCYINIPNRANITDRDLEYIKKVMQKYIDNKIKRIYIVFHPVNFNTSEAVGFTEKIINEISFKFKTVNVFYGKITEGMR